MNFVDNSIQSSLRFTEAGVKATITVARRVVQELEKEEQGDASDTLRGVMAKYVEETQKHHNDMESLKSLKTLLGKMDPSDWPDIDEEFNKIQQETNNNNKANVEDHRWMKEIKSIFDDNDGDEDSNVLDCDDDLAMTQADVNTICPISRVEMKKPVKNPDCGHVYDKASVEALFRQGDKWTKVRCPVVGCPNREPIQIKRLIEDKETRRAIAKKRQSQ